MPIAENVAALKTAVSQASLSAVFKAHVARLESGDYFALLAYIEMNEAHEQSLQAAREAVRDAKAAWRRVWVLVRAFFIQPARLTKVVQIAGVFLQVTADDQNDLPVPNQKYTFGVVKAAQARGDFEVLSERGRRALRVHLSSDVDQRIAHAASRDCAGIRIVFMSSEPCGGSIEAEN